MTKFDPQKHHRRSIRLKEYDYSDSGAYFITMVTFQREMIFGEVENGKITLTDFGHILQKVWESLPARYPELELNEMIIMPNHFHGIILIKDSPVGAVHEPSQPEPPQRKKETPEEYRLRRRRMLLPKIIGYIKMNSAKQINHLRQSEGIPVWQRDYFERVIRNEKEFERIRAYIENNPLQWELDEENTLRKDA